MLRHVNSLRSFLRVIRPVKVHLQAEVLVYLQHDRAVNDRRVLVVIARSEDGPGATRLADLEPVLWGLVAAQKKLETVLVEKFIYVAFSDQLSDTPGVLEDRIHETLFFCLFVRNGV